MTLTLAKFEEKFVNWSQFFFSAWCAICQQFRKKQDFWNRHEADPFFEFEENIITSEILQIDFGYKTTETES